MIRNFAILFVFFYVTVNAQEGKNIISIKGRVKAEKVLSIDQLKNFPLVQVDSLQIFSHTMVLHGVTRKIKGVLLKDVLESVEFDAKSPKLLSEYYIVCIAADNYKVAFSWNEIFNSSTGDKVMIALEKDGKPATESKDGIVLVTPTDRATGRRFVKELSKILIQRVN